MNVTVSVKFYMMKMTLDELDRILENGCVLDDKYRKRIDKFFTLRDENNSQRNFEAIKEICDRG